MAEDLISSVIDQPAVKSQLDFLGKGLDDLLGKIKAFAGIRIVLEGADNTKKLAEGNNQLTDSLGKVEKAQTSFSLAIKEYQKIQDDSARLEARIAAGKSEQASKLNELRNAQQKQNLETKNSAILNSANEGSIVRMRAELSLLTSQYDKLSESERNASGGETLKLKIAGLSAALKGLEGETGRFQRNVGNYSGALKVLETALTEAKTKLDSMSQSQRNNTAEGQKLEKEVKLLGALATQQAQGFSSLTQELRTGERALQTMRAAGLSNTEAFAQLSESVAEARRNFRELTRQQALLSSEAPGLQALTISARGLAGAYAVGAGAASLFSGSNEHVQKELNKLVAIMTILQGLTEFNRLLQERTAIATALLGAKTFTLNALLAIRNFILTGSTKGIVLNTVATEENAVAVEGNTVAMVGTTVATTAATVALRVFRFALLATGIGAILLLITTAASAMTSFGGSTKDAASDVDELTAALERNKQAFEDIRDETDIQTQNIVGKLKEIGASQGAIDRATLDGLKSKSDASADFALKQFKDLDKLLDKQRQLNKELEKHPTKTTQLTEKIDDVKKQIDLQKKAADDARNTAVADDVKIKQTKQEFRVRDAEEARKQAEKDLAEGKKNAEKRLQAIMEAEAREREALLNIKKQTLQDDIDLQQRIIDDDRRTAAERLDALGRQLVDRIALIDADKERQLAIEAEKQRKLAKIIGNTEAARLSANEISLIQIKANGDKNKAIIDGNVKSTAILKADAEKQEKAYEDAYKKIQDAAEKAFNAKTSKQDINKDSQLIELDNAFQHGLINQTDFEKKKQEIIDRFALVKLESERKSLIEQAIIAQVFGEDDLDIQRKLAEVELQINDDKNKKKIKSDEEAADKKKELDAKQLEAFNEVRALFSSIKEGQFDKEKNAIQEQINLIEDKSKREIDAIAASGLSEQDKANRINIINVQSQKQKEQLERRQRQVDLERARFERAQAVAEVVQRTAVAVAADLKANKFLIPYDIAIGAAQIAAILARPIPKFEKGTKDAPRGLGIYGEKGRELVIERSGKSYLSPGVPTLTQFMGGERVVPHDITRDILRAHNLLHILNGANSKNVTVIENPMFGEKIYEAIKEGNKKPPVMVNVSSSYETSIHYMQHIKY